MGSPYSGDVDLAARRGICRLALLATEPKCIPDAGKMSNAGARSEQVSDCTQLARELLQDIRQPNWQRRLDRDRRRTLGGRERDRRGVQKMPLEPDRLLAPPVHTIAHDGMPDERQMHADLVRAASLRKD